MNIEEHLMAVSALDLYKDLLPKTNCGECGYPSCFAFASIIILEKLDLAKCPYVHGDKLSEYKKILAVQFSDGKFVKKDLAADALEWARQRSSSMEIKDLPDRIGGKLVEVDGEQALEIPYFSDIIYIKRDVVTKKDGTELNPWEQVFIFNHMAQGGSSEPAGKWVGFQTIPNSIPKVSSMKRHVEEPLIKRFSSNKEELFDNSILIGGVSEPDEESSADVAIRFLPLPKIPLLLLFWDEDTNEGFGAEIKVLFDETITEHLDVESIMFLCERLKQLLCGDEFEK